MRRTVLTVLSLAWAASSRAARSRRAAAPGPVRIPPAPA